MGKILRRPKLIWKKYIRRSINSQMLLAIVNNNNNNNNNNYYRL